MSPAAERLRYILGDDEETMPTPTLFTEMDTLQHEGDELEWRESARYENTLKPDSYHIYHIVLNHDKGW